MKAIVIEQAGGSEQLQYQEVDKPELNEGQVLVKMAAAPVNYIDTMIRQGNMPPGMMPELPYISGVEGSGIVADANGSGLTEGQKVAFIGPIGAATYAEYTAVDADKLFLLPESSDLLIAGSMTVAYLTAHHMLHNVARVQEGGIAVVYAASGGVGTALVQLAKAAGLTVIALERREEKRQLSLDNGADYAILTTQEDWVEQVKQATGGHGVNYIFNSVAGDTIVEDFEILAPLGHVVIYGLMGGVGETNLQEQAFNHFGKAPTVSYSEIYATFFNQFEQLAASMKEVYRLLEEGRLKPVFTTLSLSDANRAHDLLESGQVTGKLVLVP